MADVLNEITKIISKRSSVPVEGLTPETRLNDIGIQSFDLIEIVFDIEERFNIDVPLNANTDSRLEFTTISQIAEGVRSILDNSPAS